MSASPHSRKWLFTAGYVLAGVAALPPLLSLVTGRTFPGNQEPALWTFAAGCFALALIQLLPEFASKKMIRTSILFVWMLLLLLISNRIGPGRIMPVRALFALGTLFVLLRLFYFAVVKKEGLPGWRKNLRTAGFTFVALFLLAETVFMFVPWTEGSTASLSTQIWFARHWNPINAWGYRDIPPDTCSNCRKLLVLGDSFAAGQGIDNIADRFPDRLRESMPASWRTYNLSICGADSRDEFNFLNSFPEKADAILLQYYPNDIEAAATEAGHQFSPEDLPEWNPVLRFLILHSHAVNFIYAYLPRHDFGYGSYLKEIWADPRVWEIHFADLNRFADYAQAHQARLVVVLFPFMNQPQQSAEHLKKVKSFLESKQVTVVDLSEEIENIPAEERTVNHNDAHPSVRFHEHTAERCLPVLKSVLGDKWN